MIKVGTLSADILEDPTLSETDLGFPHACYNKVTSWRGRMLSITSEHPLVYPLILGRGLAPNHFIEKIELDHANKFILLKMVALNGDPQDTVTIRDQNAFPRNDKSSQFEFDGKGWAEAAKQHDQSHLIMARILREQVTPGSQVLDLGGGPGLVEEALGDLNASVTIVDGSEAMLAELKNRREAGLLPKVTKQVHQCMGWDEESNTPVELLNPKDRAVFDTVFSNGCFPYLSSVKDVFREVARLLKPGGQFHFSIIEPVGEEGVRFSRSQRGRINLEGIRYPLPQAIWMNSQSPDLAAIGDGAIDREMLKTMGRFEYFYDMQDILRLLVHFGFENIVTQKHFAHIEPTTGAPIEYTFVSAQLDPKPK